MAAYFCAEEWGEGCVCVWENKLDAMWRSDDNDINDDGDGTRIKPGPARGMDHSLARTKTTTLRRYSVPSLLSLVCLHC